MNTMKWLLRREFWEHKGALMWAPVVVGTLMVLLISSIAALGISQGKLGDSVTVNGEHVSATAMIKQLPPEKLQYISDAVAGAYMGLAAPLLMVMAIVVFFYCLACLGDERRDRSILFWKSLPVSDSETVLSKVIIAAFVAPLITIAVAFVVSLLTMLIIGAVLAFNGINLFGAILSNTDFYLMPLRVIGLLPVYILWALPTIGWLMMVSAWAKSKAFLWAVGAPIIAVIMIKWAQFLLGVNLDVHGFVYHVISRGLVGLVPGVWLPLTEMNPRLLMDASGNLSAGLVFEQSYLSLTHPSAWIGALAGAAMIFAAMRLRRWKDEG